MITLSRQTQAQSVVEHWKRVARDLDGTFRKAALAVAPRLVAELQRRMAQGGSQSTGSENRSEPEWLAQHITAWVDGSTVWVGIPDLELAVAAFDLEHGAVVDQRYVPARPVMRPVVLQMHQLLSQAVEKEMVKLFAGAR